MYQELELSFMFLTSDNLNAAKRTEPAVARHMQNIHPIEKENFIF